MVFSMLADILGVDEGTAMMLSQLLVAVGAINWGLIGFTGLTGMDSFNLVTTLLGEGMLTNVVYTLVGAAGLDVASDLLY